MPEGTKQMVSNQSEASTILGVTVETLRKWRERDDFPWGGPAGYDIDAIREWAAQFEPLIEATRDKEENMPSSPGIIENLPEERTEPDSQHSERGRQCNQVICPYCKVKCKSRRSEPFYTRYYCTDEGCSYSVKIPRPILVESAKRRRVPQDEDDYGARD